MARVITTTPMSRACARERRDARADDMLRMRVIDGALARETYAPRRFDAAMRTMTRMISR